jgi:hypothetical protein
LTNTFIKEKLWAGIICTPYVKIGEQLVDILTKGASSSVGHVRHLCLSLRGGVEDGNYRYVMILFYSLIYFYYSDCNLLIIPFHNNLYSSLI